MTLIVDWEPFSSMWGEAVILASAHYHEVEGSLAEKRPFKVNAPDMQRYDEAGILKVVTARLDGKLIGYATFTLMPDIESMDCMFGNQGAIYVAPGHEKLNVARKMIDFAVSGLKRLGAKYVLLHHRLLGRGVNMGVLFKRKGAVPIKHEYFLWVGD